MAIHNKEYDHEAAKKSLEKFLEENPHAKKQLEKAIKDFDWDKFNKDIKDKFVPKRGWPSDGELQAYFLQHGFWEFITWLKERLP